MQADWSLAACADRRSVRITKTVIAWHHWVWRGLALARQ